MRATVDELGIILTYLVALDMNVDRRDTSSSSGEHENVEKDDKDGILADIVTESEEASEGLNSTCHEVTVNTKKQFNAADAYEFLCQRGYIRN